jgi:SHS2 domain-containing protein
MFVAATVDLREAFRELESGLLDVQTDVDMLEEESADDEESRNA